MPSKAAEHNKCRSYAKIQLHELQARQTTGADWGRLQDTRHQVKRHISDGCLWSILDLDPIQHDLSQLKVIKRCVEGCRAKDIHSYVLINNWPKNRIWIPLFSPRFCAISWSWWRFWLQASQSACRPLRMPSLIPIPWLRKPAMLHLCYLSSGACQFVPPRLASMQLHDARGGSEAAVLFIGPSRSKIVFLCSFCRRGGLNEFRHNVSKYDKNCLGSPKLELLSFIRECGVDTLLAHAAELWSSEG